MYICIVYLLPLLILNGQECVFIPVKYHSWSEKPQCMSKPDLWKQKSSMENIIFRWHLRLANHNIVQDAKPLYKHLFISLSTNILNSLSQYYSLLKDRYFRSTSLDKYIPILGAKRPLQWTCQR